MSESATTEATIIEIVDACTCAINRGSQDGVKRGDRYLIYGLGGEMTDPETGEALGQLELVRGRGKVIHVQERLATIESSETITTPDRTRIIKRERGGVFFGSAPEEIREPGKVEMVPFKKIKKGDRARPI